MKYDVTRDVVSDLWPLYRGGEATQDSRTLIEAFCADDPGFAAAMRASRVPAGVMPALQLSPDAERRLLDAARERARLKLLVIGGGIALAGLILLTALIGLLLTRGGVL
ncbi:MAG TPA: hypothetical protein PLL30_09030 [Candidatus Krumholzibacteria bacterium]|nr:hypothetical protein [Candidatus Krumholzibacteria bacterium]HPD71903.1 hypothetical protein [Candidatus Krumholzibacteria bacterium]HRY41164.1 hypothetical protein [Candidatus Krumholzibacteria bacterium]